MGGVASEHNRILAAYNEHRYIQYTTNSIHSIYLAPSGNKIRIKPTKCHALWITNMRTQKAIFQLVEGDIWTYIATLCILKEGAKLYTVNSCVFVWVCVCKEGVGIQSYYTLNLTGTYSQRMYIICQILIWIWTGQIKYIGERLITMWTAEYGPCDVKRISRRRRVYAYCWSIDPHSFSIGALQK